MADTSKPLFGRILAVALALALIGLIGFVANGFMGNPISAYIANRQMTKYVRQTYPEMNLTLTKASYNFKSSGYSLKASSPTSPDTHFTVTRRSDGKIVDDYRDYVLSGFNTIDRLGREMTNEVAPLLMELFGDQMVGRCFADLFGEHKILPDIPLDTPFSRDLKIPATIYIDFDVENPTLDEAAAKLQQADDLLQEKGYTVAGYIVELLHRERKRGYTMHVSSELVNADLAAALKHALANESYGDKLWVREMR